MPTARHSPHCAADPAQTAFRTQGAADPRAYIAHLPPGLRERATAVPESTWWSWPEGRLHIARARRPGSAVRLVVIHGAGGHAGALWPAAALAADIGYEVDAPDLPGYGLTELAPGAVATVPMMCDVLTRWLDASREADPRPVLLLGASMGGLLAYDLAVRCRVPVDGLVATCLLDARREEVRQAMARWPWLARWAPQLLRRLPDRLAALKLPIAWVAPMARIANPPELSRLCRSDPLGGGRRVPLAFLRSLMEWVPACEPEAFTRNPVVLAHPTHDRWTPAALSLGFFERLAAPREYLPLEGCGHFPVEQPGIGQLQACMVSWYARLAGAAVTARGR